MRRVILGVISLSLLATRFVCVRVCVCVGEYNGLNNPLVYNRRQSFAKKRRRPKPTQLRNLIG